MPPKIANGLAPKLKFGNESIAAFIELTFGQL